MTATRLVITGTWVTETDTPASGRIQFQANDVGFVNGGELVRAGVQGYALDKTGSINVSLIRCPDGYTVTEQINGAYKRSYILPDQVGPVDLRDVVALPIGVVPATQASLDAEIATRIAADTTEATTRGTNDTALAALISAEASARASGDSAGAAALNAAIAALSGTYVPKSVVTTAADLIVGTGAGAVARLGKGTALQVLRVNAGATALEYGDAGSGSGLPATFRTMTSAGTAAAGEWIEADATAAGFPITLPPAPATGALVAVKKIDATANTVTIAPSGGGTIDGDPTATTATRWAGAVFEHKGSNVWRVAASMTTTGTAGINGTNGNSVLNGTGAPSAGTGVNGDFYIDTTAKAIYGPKAGGTWGAGTSMLGTNGTNGAISVIEDEGSALAVRSNLNFTGAGVTAADSGGKTVVTIPGGAPSYGIPRSFPAAAANTGALTVQVANRAYFYRCIDPGATISAVVLRVWVSSGNISVAICTSLPGRHNPDTRVATTGTIACPAGGTVSIPLGSSVTMTENHWFAISCDNTSAQFIAMSGSAGELLIDVALGLAAQQASAHPIPASPAPTAGFGVQFAMVGA